MLAVNVRVVEVAPGRSVKVVPPSVLTCHCTVGAGDPVAAALNEAVCPEVTVRLVGEDVTDRVGQEDVEVEVGVVPLVVFVTPKSCGRMVTTIAVVAMQPWLSVRVKVKLSVPGAVSVCSCDSLTW